MRKAILAGLAAFVLCGALAATAAAGETSIRFCWWGGSERHEATLKAIAAFEQLHPDIKVKGEYMGWGGYPERITVQIGGNSEADLLQLNWAWLSIYSKSGDGFYDLNKLGDKIDKAAFDQKWLDSTTVKGKLNALPVSFTTHYFIWNKSVFEKAGLDVPKTWDDLVNAGRVFKEKLGDEYYPLDGSRNTVVNMTHAYMFQKTGKMFFDPETNKIGFTLEDTKEWLGIYKRLLDNHAIVPLSLRASRSGNVDSQTHEAPDYIEGRWAGAYNWDSTFSLMFGTPKKEFQLVLGEYLTQDGAKTSGRIGRPSMIFAISKNTKHADAAAAFLNYLLTSPEAAGILKTTRGVLLSKPSYAELEKQNLISPVTKEALEQIAKVKVYSPSPYFEDPRAQELMNSAFETISFNTTSVDDAAQKLMSEGETLLRRLTR